MRIGRSKVRSIARSISPSAWIPPVEAPIAITSVRRGRRLPLARTKERSGGGAEGGAASVLRLPSARIFPSSWAR